MKIDLPNYDEREKVGTEIVIHSWDTWNMDHTLALIILPLLKQLKETTHGAPAVEEKDVPMDLWIPVEEFLDIYDGKTDENYFKRWEYVLDEMIYAFDCKANKEEPYIRIENTEECKKEQERISNGFRLFGKYYEALWD